MTTITITKSTQIGYALTTTVTRSPGGGLGIDAPTSPGFVGTIAQVRTRLKREAVSFRGTSHVVALFVDGRRVTRLNHEDAITDAKSLLQTMDWADFAEGAAAIVEEV